MRIQSRVSRVFPERRFCISAGEFVAKCVLIRAIVGKRAKIDSCVALMQFARVEDVRDSGEGDSLYFSFSFRHNPSTEKCVESDYNIYYSDSKDRYKVPQSSLFFPKSRKLLRSRRLGEEGA